MAGYQLSPLERQNVTDILQHAGSGVDPGMLFSLLQGTVEGAQTRRAEKVQARQSIAAELRDRAMQLATSGAEESAVAAALGGMAQGTPLSAGPRGERRVGKLMDYVGNLYGEEGPISGLAPADLRAQFNTAGGALPEELRMQVAGEIAEQTQKGLPFREQAEIIRRGAIAMGHDELTTEALLGEAEMVYERLIGTSLEEMRGTGDVLRSRLSDPGSFDAGVLSGETGIEESAFGGVGPGSNVEGFLAQAVNDPRLYGQLSRLRGAQPPQEERSPWAMMADPSTWFFQG